MNRVKNIEKAEETARRATARFDALLDAAVDAIIVIDSRGAIEAFSRAATEIFGYALHEVAGKNVNMLMPDPYRHEHDDYIQNYLQTGNAKIIGIGREVSARRKDGSVFPIDLAVGEVHDGSEMRFVGIIRDISARKASELEMRQQRERLAHVTRLSTMGEMAAGIAHEVNQPLTAIATYSNASRRMLASSDADLPELSDLLEKISAQAIRAGEVIRRLRRFLKKREGEYETLSLNELVHDIAALAEVDARHHNVKLIIETGEEDVLVLVDAVQIQQVLLNLVRNGIEAMATEDHADKSVSIRLISDSANARVEVIDRGQGIEDSMRDRLFTPFQTTKSFGMGMGLTISRSIIKAHKGMLAFKDNPGGGSIFYFELPVTKGDLAE